MTLLHGNKKHVKEKKNIKTTNTISFVYSIAGL